MDIDVSKCCYYNSNEVYPCELYQNNCEDQNCYYKQLQQIKQENEQLKEQINCKCFDSKSNNNRCISYNRIADDYEKDIQNLKKIKSKIRNLTNISFELSTKNLYFEQKLKKIKEICDKNICIDNNGYCPQIKDISDIIESEE